MRTAKPPKPRTSRIRKNIPRPAKWQCPHCDTWNAPTDRRCHTCGS